MKLTARISEKRTVWIQQIKESIFENRWIEQTQKIKRRPLAPHLWGTTHAELNLVCAAVRSGNPRTTDSFSRAGRHGNLPPHEWGLQSRYGSILHLLTLLLTDWQILPKAGRKRWNRERKRKWELLNYKESLGMLASQLEYTDLREMTWASKLSIWAW